MSEARTTKRFTSPAIRALVSIALIVVVVTSLDTGELRQAFLGVSFLTLLLLTGIDILLRLLSAYRWHVLFKSTNAASSLSETTRISFVSSFLGQALPGVIGVEALRVYGLAKSSKDSAAAFASVVADRVFGLVSLVLVILLGLLIGPTELQQVILLPVLTAFALLVAGVLTVTVPSARRLVERFVPDAFLLRVRDWVDKVYRCFDYYRTQPGLIGYSLLLATVFQLLRVALFFAAAILLGASPQFVYFVAIVPIVMFAALLPVSIGGLGVREAGLVLLFSRFEVMDSATTFTVAILVFISGLLSTLPGGWYFVKQRKQLKEAIKHSS